MKKVAVKTLVLFAALACLAFAASAAEPDYTGEMRVGPAGELAGPMVPDCNDPMNPLSNCGFETGDLTDWGFEDMDTPFAAIAVVPAGATTGFGFFVTAPTEGLLSMAHGFDGDGGTGSVNAIRVWQEVSLPPGADALQFDYRGAWDLTFGGTLDRTFRVDVEPMGGGAALQSTTLLTAPQGDTTVDTGVLAGVVDVSAFGGSDVRLSLEWDVPEDFSGPGLFEVDNVSVSIVAPPPTEIPTLSQWGLGGMVGLMAIAALWLLVRRSS